MLKQIFINLAKSQFSAIFLILSMAALVFVCYQIAMYLKRKKKKIAISVIVLSGFIIFAGIESIIISFMPPDEQALFAYAFLIKIGLFFLGIAEIYLGIFLLQLKKWARALILWFVVIFGLGDILVAITGNNFSDFVAEAGMYAIVFTAYYLGLNKKYFKKEDEGFSLHADAATKKKPMSFFDWLNE